MKFIHLIFEPSLAIYEQEKHHNSALLNAWVFIQDSQWSEKVRYAEPFSCRDDKATQFIDSVKILLQWIQQH
ncbi:MAG: hypothetical protein EAZ92_08840 [Candidatus Kapaibacterium sp.]|nr:MAG: hypothetical protein EAZ92_08840 [Candidatus Kapabacteria bacterium]